MPIAPVSFVKLVPPSEACISQCLDLWADQAHALNAPQVAACVLSVQAELSRSTIIIHAAISTVEEEIAAIWNATKGDDVPGKAERVLINLGAVAIASGLIVYQLDLLEVRCIAAARDWNHAAGPLFIRNQIDDGSRSGCRCRSGH